MTTRTLALMTLCSLVMPAPASAQEPDAGHAPAQAVPAEVRTMTPYLVAMSVPSVSATVAWYRDQLGFTLTEQKDLPEYKLRIAFMELNGFRLELIEHQDSLSPDEVQRRVPQIKDWTHVQGLVKLAFLVDKVAPVADRLRRKGVRFQAQVMAGQGSWGDSFIVRDVNGNWIQFAEKPMPPRARASDRPTP